MITVQHYSPDPKFALLSCHAFPTQTAVKLGLNFVAKFILRGGRRGSDHVASSTCL